MASEVEICNMILVPLGVDRISSLTEETEGARKCNATYTNFRDQELSSHTWSFATYRVQLAQTTGTPAFGYDLEFQLPSDSLRIVNIDTMDYGYKVEGDKLVTNYTTPYVRYIRRITDPNKFTQPFIEVLVARGQYELCFALTGSKTLMTGLYEVYERKRRRAVAIDSQSSGTPDKYVSDRLIDSRTGNVF